MIYTVEPGAYGRVISQTHKSGSVWTPSYYHFDALGRTSRLTSSSKFIVASVYYAAFGEIITDVGLTISNFRWCGEHGYYFDADLLDNYIRARSYRPVLIRWLSEDPIEFDAGDVNLFRYVGNNPVNLIDPGGQFLLPLILIGIGIGLIGGCGAPPKPVPPPKPCEPGPAPANYYVPITPKGGCVLVQRELESRVLGVSE